MYARKHMRKHMKIHGHSHHTLSGEKFMTPVTFTSVSPFKPNEIRLKVQTKFTQNKNCPFECFSDQQQNTEEYKLISA